jgi:DNA invertase Pin-like site-specific DNA recombinase
VKQRWVETGRYSDAERSGTTTMGRQGLFQMLAAAERHEFDILLVEDIDRASRDAADMHRIAKDLEELDIVLCTVVGGVVSDMELAFKAVQNQQYVKQNAFKSKRGQENVVANGRMSGSVAYGYRKVLKFDSKGEPINGLREIDPKTSAIVVRIHEDFDAGKTTFEICKTLNAEGIPSPKGKLWRPGSLLGNRHGGLGILRNPIYRGEFQFRKTQRKRRKDRIRTRFTAISERIVVQHSDLAIVDPDLWDRNQARLTEAFDRPFYTKRKVEYVFTGKVFCGRCGCTSIVSDGKFVCTGHQQNGVCDNTRRVWREAVESSVLGRIKQHLLSADLLGPCLEAYREESERALADHAALTEGGTARLREIGQQIANLMIQLGASGEASFSSQMLLAEVDRLGAEKARLEHQIKLAPRPSLPALGTDTIIERIGLTLDDLQQALQLDDREASRARELVRGLIDRLVLSPTPDSKTDGRGAGDMTVTAEGPLAALIDLADLSIDRVTKHGRRPTFILDNATSVWRFSYVLEWRDTRLSVVRADMPILSKLLDEADVPVTFDAFVAALKGAGAASGGDYARSPQQRARNAVAYLQAQGFTRCINMRSVSTGYVWNDRGLSDDEWKARIANPPMTQTIPAIRIGAPEATVVVIGPRCL